MADTLGWLATALMTLAAVMVASNAGTRITGWGFVLFTLSSLIWTAVAVLSGVASLAVANAVMIGINAFGIWRWLGRQARIEEGSARAEERSRRAPLPTLVSAAGLIGTEVAGPDGAPCGKLIDLMLRADSQQVAYGVVGTGGVAGMGERLCALAPEELALAPGEPRSRIAAADLEGRPAVDPSAWPVTPPRSR